MTRLALVSDPHGDLAALRRAIALEHDIGADAIWCLGDLVGDPYPNETVELALSACDVVIAANHDLLAVHRLDEGYVASHGPRIIAIREALTESNRTILISLPDQYVDSDVIATHACLDHPTARIFDGYEAELQLALCDEDVLIVGHSHAPFAYVQPGTWIADPVTVGAVDISPRAVVCPGSVIEVESAPATICLLDLAAGARRPRSPSAPETVCG
jgi:predicted phosphodiesterase